MAAEHLQRGLDRRADVGALQRDAAGPGEGLHPRGRAFDPLQGLGHHLHVFGEVGVVLHALADPPQAVLHAVQRIGDLMGDARHELADAQHLLLLPDGGVGPIDVAADRGREVDRDPQRPAEGQEQPGQAHRGPAAAAVRAGRRENGWRSAESIAGIPGG